MVFRARPRTLVLEYGPMHLEYGHLEYAQEVSGCTGSRTAYRSIVRGEKKVRANYWLEGCDIQSHGFCMCCIIFFGRYTVLAAGSAVLYCMHMQHCTYIICSYSICICCLHILSAVWGLSSLAFFPYSICELEIFHILSPGLLLYYFVLQKLARTTSQY